MPSTIDLSAYRHATWGGPAGSDYLAFLGEDLATATFSWSFADQPGGSVLFTLSNQPPGYQGMSATFDPEYLHPQTGRRVGATIVTPQIDETTLENLPDPPATADTLVLVHTLYVTRADGLKHAQFGGVFRILQGAPN